MIRRSNRHESVNLDEHAAKTLLQDEGVAIPRGGIARSVEETARLAEELGGAVVLKALVPMESAGSPGPRAPGGRRVSSTGGKPPCSSVPTPRATPLIQCAWKSAFPSLQSCTLPSSTIHALAPPDSFFPRKEAWKSRAPCEAPRAGSRARDRPATRPGFGGTRSFAGAVRTRDRRRRKTPHTFAKTNGLSANGMPSCSRSILSRSTTTGDFGGARLQADHRRRVAPSATKLPEASRTGTELENAPTKQAFSISSSTRRGGSRQWRGTDHVHSGYGRLLRRPRRPTSWRSAGDAYRKATEALDIVLANPRVKSLLVNLCGAYARTDVMMEGLLEGWKELKPDVPVSFSVHGTGEDRAIEAPSRQAGHRATRYHGRRRTTSHPHGGNAMSFSEHPRVMVQGITGQEASFWTERMIACGTEIVAGVTPGKGGRTVHGCARVRLRRGDSTRARARTRACCSCRLGPRRPPLSKPSSTASSGSRF